MDKEKTGFIGFLKRKKLLLLFILAMAAVIAYAASNALKPALVSVQQVTKDTFIKTVEEVAYVSDAGQYELFSQNGGEVSKIRKKPGEKVKAGEVVLELKNPQTESQASQIDVQVSQINGQITAQNAVVKAAETSLDAAQREMERCKSLFDEGGISKAEMDAAEQAYKVALESYEGARAALVSLNSQKAAIINMLTQQENINKELIVKSPKDGILLDMPWQEGQLVSPGQLLMVVGEGGMMSIKADYLADDTVDMQIGQKVIITSPVLPQDGVQGVISSIDPIALEKISALGIAQRRVGVKIDAEPVKGLKPGFEVRAAVITQEIEDAVVISQAFIHQMDQRNIVWLIEDEKLQEREVTIVAQNSKQAVVSGIKEGDMIVTGLPENAKEGMKVSVTD